MLVCGQQLGVHGIVMNFLSLYFHLLIFFDDFFYDCFLGRCEVGILEVPKESPLGRLRGSDNVVTPLFCLLIVYSSLIN